jgi:hypothetical protein
MLVRKSRDNLRGWCDERRGVALARRTNGKKQGEFDCDQSFVAKGIGPALAPLQVPAFNETEDTSPVLGCVSISSVSTGGHGPHGSNQSVMLLSD